MKSDTEQNNKSNQPSKQFRVSDKICTDKGSQFFYYIDEKQSCKRGCSSLDRRIICTERVKYTIPWRNVAKDWCKKEK